MLEIQGVDDGVPVLSATCAGVMSVPPLMPCDKRQPEAVDKGFDFLDAMNVMGQAGSAGNAPRARSDRRPSDEEFDFEAALAELLDSTAASYDKLQQDMRAQDVMWVQEEDVAEKNDNDEAAEAELLLEMARPTPASTSSEQGIQDQGQETEIEPQPFALPVDGDTPLVRLLRAIAWTDHSTHSRFHFRDGRGELALTVVPMNGLKATCRSHKNCVLWLSAAAVTAPDKEPLADIVQWAFDGDSMQADDHWRAAQKLKLAYGMKVRV